MGEDWFATHAAGFGSLVARLAARDLPGADVEADGDNALRLRLTGGRGSGGAAADPAAQQRLLSYCRGLFRVLGEERGGLEAAARAFARGAFDGSRLGGGRPGGGGRQRDIGRQRDSGSFALRGFGPDDPAPIPPAQKRELEALIARATGMRPDSSRAGRDYRLQERADGRVLFLERMGAAKPEPELRRGELPRATCRLLAEMTEPEADDVFVDPFCGYGGIALERALAAPYRFVFAQDLDPEKVAAVKESLGAKAFEKRRKTFFPKSRDALDPSAFEAGFVTAIATDPPWGLYEGAGSAAAGGSAGAEALLGAFLAVASTQLAPAGRLVILVSRGLADGAAFRSAKATAGSGAGAAVAGRKTAVSGAGAAVSGAGAGAFILRERLDVLVSGKKASVLRLDRR